MSEDKLLSFEFTAKELNYIEMSLIERVRSLENDGLRDAENIPHIRQFSKVLVNKIRVGRGYPKMSFRRLRRETGE